MALAALDTLEVAKQLKAAGFTDGQAEAVTRAMRDAQNLDISDLATKADFLTLSAATKADFLALSAATKADLLALKGDVDRALAETKVDILKWMVGTIGVQTVLILGAVVTLMRMMAPH